VIGKFVVKPHQNKEAAYVRALAGKYQVVDYRKVRSYKDLLFGLFDNDIGHRQYHLARLHRAGAKTFVYPHTARPMLYWDWGHEPWPYTSCLFAQGVGHEMVLRRYGYELPVEVTGWTYSEIKPFKPVKKVENVLFGPIHPCGVGLAWLSKIDLDYNRRVHAALVGWCRDNGAHLTVRYIHELANNGIEPEKDVTYVRGKKEQTDSFKQIESADLVVGHQTFAYLAVALGKPTLMFGEDTPPRDGINDKTLVFVRSWEKYADLMIYPLDALSGNGSMTSLGQLIETATTTDIPIAQWRERFIGKPFEPGYFVERLESYL